MGILVDLFSVGSSFSGLTEGCSGVFDFLVEFGPLDLTFDWYVDGIGYTEWRW